jgi:hypothetical protein
VANPRSAIRLAPRRALSSWFDSGEMIRPTDVSRDKAARHLVAAHREELAALLQEASWISYWKAPVLAHRPIGADGRLYHPTQREPDWFRRVERQVSISPGRSHDVELLRQCLVGIKPQQGWTLAKGSLSLVPSDRTRCYLALNAQWHRPRTAIALFGRIERCAQPASLRPTILLSLGSQTCHLGLVAEARNYYRASSTLDPYSPYGWSYAFNLSCFLGDETRAREAAAELGRLAGPQDSRVLDIGSVLRDWWKTRSGIELGRALMFMERMKNRIPEVAAALFQATKP